jgi:tRNA pseudouridine55 synthase
LPICIGKATRLIEYLEDDKEYIATIQFGKNTDSYDVDGKITEVFEKKITREDLLGILKTFEGEIFQLPPIYSAIKVNGKKLYDYARQGEDVEIQPRKVYISKIELLDFDFEIQVAKIIVGCSKGTYIRSIAYDIGKILGCGGYLSALERTKAGKFYVEKSIKLEEITEKEFVEKNIINPLEVIDFPKYILSEDDAKKVSHGMSISNDGFKDEDIVFLIYSGKMYAIGRVDKNKILVKKVFEVS